MDNLGHKSDKER